MKFEDVMLNMKVVPHSKSVWTDGENFDDYINGSSYYDNVPNFFRNNGYLEVVDYDTDIEAFVLGGYDGIDGDYFLAEDFEPYEETKENKEEIKNDKLVLLSEIFSKIFNEPIKFVNRTTYEEKELVDNDFPSQRKRDRAENFYNALVSNLIVMNNEVQARNDALPHLDGYDEVEFQEEIATLQDSINWTTDAYSIAIADCLGIDPARDDYFNIFYDAITKGYGFEWMVEKLKKEEVL